MSIGFEVECRELQVLCRNPVQYKQRFRVDGHADYDCRLFDVTVDGDLKVEVAIDHTARQLSLKKGEHGIIKPYPVNKMKQFGWEGEFGAAIIEIKTTPYMKKDSGVVLEKAVAKVKMVAQFLETAYLLQYLDLNERVDRARATNKRKSMLAREDVFNEEIFEIRSIKEWYHVIRDKKSYLDVNKEVPKAVLYEISNVAELIRDYEKLQADMLTWDTSMPAGREEAKKMNSRDIKDYDPVKHAVRQADWHWDNYVFDTIQPSKTIVSDGRWSSKYSIQSNGSIHLSALCDTERAQYVKGLLGHSHFAYHGWVEIGKRITKYFDQNYKAIPEVSPLERENIKGFIFLFIWTLWCRNEYHDYLVEVKKQTINEEKQYSPMLIKTNTVLTCHSGLKGTSHQFLVNNTNDLLNFIGEVLSDPEKGKNYDHKSNIPWGYNGKTEQVMWVPNKDENIINNYRKIAVSHVNLGRIWDRIVQRGSVKNKLGPDNQHDASKVNYVEKLLTRASYWGATCSLLLQSRVRDPLGITGKNLNTVCYDGKPTDFDNNKYNSNPKAENPMRKDSAEVVIEARSHDCQKVHYDSLEDYLIFISNCWAGVQGFDHGVLPMSITNLKQMTESKFYAVRCEDWLLTAFKKEKVLGGETMSYSLRNNEFINPVTYPIHIKTNNAIYVHKEMEVIKYEKPIDIKPKGPLGNIKKPVISARQTKLKPPLKPLSKPSVKPNIVAPVESQSKPNIKPGIKPLANRWRS